MDKLRGSVRELERDKRESTKRYREQVKTLSLSLSVSMRRYSRNGLSSRLNHSIRNVKVGTIKNNITKFESRTFPTIERNRNLVESLLRRRMASMKSNLTREMKMGMNRKHLLLDLVSSILRQQHSLRLLLHHPPIQLPISLQVLWKLNSHFEHNSILSLPLTPHSPQPYELYKPKCPTSNECTKIYKKRTKVMKSCWGRKP